MYNREQEDRSEIASSSHNSLRTAVLRLEICRNIADSEDAEGCGSFPIHTPLNVVQYNASNVVNSTRSEEQYSENNVSLFIYRTLSRRSKLCGETGEATYRESRTALQPHICRRPVWPLDLPTPERPSLQNTADTMKMFLFFVRKRSKRLEHTTLELPVTTEQRPNKCLLQVSTVLKPLLYRSIYLSSISKPHNFFDNSGILLLPNLISSMKDKG